MRARSFLAVSLLLGPTYLACQLVDPASDLTESAREGGAAPDAAPPVDATTGDGAPSDATTPDASGDVADASDAGDASDAFVDSGPFCLGVDASFCDGFDQDGVITPIDCATGSVAVNGGRLVVDHPPTPGSSFSTCVFEDEMTGNISGFTLDYDFRYQVDQPDAAVQFAVVSSVEVALPSPNDAGILDIDYQMLVDNAGHGELLAVSDYPNAAKSPQGLNFTSWHLAGLYSDMFVAPGTDCHISMTVDTVAVTGSATSMCDGKGPSALATGTDHPPPGIAAPATLHVGYAQSTGTLPYPEWSLSYDNVLLRTHP